jgi:hypothetical protein
VLPTWNEFSPATLTDIEIFGLVLRALTMSASRPPHPVVKGWSGTLLCHWTCWFACEKSCGGSATVPALYWASVTGWTSVPVLARSASLPWPKSCLDLGAEGCRPQERPSL